MLTLYEYIFENIKKENQLDLILKSNPTDNNIHTWIRNIDDIKSWDEVYQMWVDDGKGDATPDFKVSDIEKVNKTRKVTVYSSKKIKNGVFVTPSKMEALNYGGSNVKTVSVDDIAWIDILQGQYAKID